METEIITDDIKQILRDTFKELKEPVRIEVFTKQGINDKYNEITLSLLKQIASLSNLIDVSFHEIGGQRSIERKVDRSPTVLIAPDKYSIRFTGAPLGEEGRSLIMSIIMASTGSVIIEPDSVKKLLTLKERRDIRVFVSPTCPYCPQQFLYAVSCAIARPELITAEAMEIYENRDIALKLGIVSVPQTTINGVLTGKGLQPEEFFIESVMTGVEPSYVSTQYTGGIIEKDILIIGGGPAGLTAGIYAERAGLKSVLLEKSALGGQVAITPIVENYPGFTSISGRGLVDLLVQQASQYTEIHQAEEVRSIKGQGEGFFVETNRASYKVRGIIICTGATHKRLDVPGEDRLYGRGVSYCATCDGYLFKDGKRVFVVGGGNSAVTDALYLHNLGANVSIIHRRDTLRAEARLQESLKASGIKILFNSEIREIIGERFVKAIKVENTKTHNTEEYPADAVFIAIGYEPSNEIAKMLGLELDPEGYIKVDQFMRTSMPFVYAAGDITGGIKQISVAVSQGSIAALTAFEDITNPYWKKH